MDIGARWAAVCGVSKSRTLEVTKRTRSHLTRAPGETHYLHLPWISEWVQSLVFCLSFSQLGKQSALSVLFFRSGQAPCCPVGRKRREETEGNSPCKTWLWLNSFQLPWNPIFFWTWICHQSHSWKAVSSSPVLTVTGDNSFPRTWGGRSGLTDNVSFHLLRETEMSGVSALRDPRDILLSEFRRESDFYLPAISRTEGHFDISFICCYRTLKCLVSSPQPTKTDLRLSD